MKKVRFIDTPENTNIIKRKQYRDVVRCRHGFKEAMQQYHNCDRIKRRKQNCNETKIDDVTWNTPVSISTLSYLTI